MYNQLRLEQSLQLYHEENLCDFDRTNYKLWGCVKLHIAFRNNKWTRNIGVNYWWLGEDLFTIVSYEGRRW